MKKGHKGGTRKGGDDGHGKYTSISRSEQYPVKSNSEEDVSNRDSNASDTSSPFSMSPWNNTSSSPPASAAVHYTVSPAANQSVELIGSLVREEGHIYSLASFGDLLYTGSDSKNIRVWKNQKEYAGFKSTSGLVKAVVISSDHRVFTGHQDGKIRVWRVSPNKNPKLHKRVGTLPKLKDFLKTSVNSKNRVPNRHTDAISALALSEDQTLLYSASWDRTLKVWRIADCKCLESVRAHNDAINVVVDGFDPLVLTGSADGTVKVWRREPAPKGKTKHTEVQALLKQESAVTALAVNRPAGLVYSGSSDGVVNFWERGLVHGGVLHGHKLAVLCLTATGGLLFSGSADQTICVWGREQSGAHVCLSVLTGHDGPVKCLAVGAGAGGGGDGAEPNRSWILYSGSLDKSVKIWKVSEEIGDSRRSEDSSFGPPKFDMY